MDNSPLLECLSPAKINIRLKVVRKREDGYHDLDSIMVPINLWDLLQFYRAPEGEIYLKCKGKPLPCSENNLVFRAAQAFFSASHVKGGIDIRLIKAIPIAAGLGGGSSNAAITLTALNRIFGNPLEASKLWLIAKELGADVPFFLDPKPSIARGIGHVLLPIKNWPLFWYVIFVPPIEVSTSWVYGQLKLGLTKKSLPDIFNYLKREDFQISLLLENDLETVTVAAYPEIAAIKALFQKLGAEGTLMSGSGPSVFALFKSREEALGAAKTIKWAKKGEVFVVTQWNSPIAHQKRFAAGVSSSGKTRAFGARIRRFESSHPSHFLCGNEPES